MKRTIAPASSQNRADFFRLSRFMWLLTLMFTLGLIQASGQSQPTGSDLQNGTLIGSGKKTPDLGIQQQLTVTGIVTSSTDKLPLPGVTIFEKGSVTNATTTGTDGKFIIRVAGENSILVLSFIGMKGKEVPEIGRAHV